MRINIEASAEELAEIVESGIAIGDLPESIIVALDDCLSLPGYKVTVNDPSAIQAQLVKALQDAIKELNVYSEADSGESFNSPAMNDALAAAGAQP